MALVLCRECNKEVSHKAEKCPHCGEPDPSRRQRDANIFRYICALVLLAGTILYFWFAVLPDIRAHGLFHTTSQRR